MPAIQPASTAAPRRNTRSATSGASPAFRLTHPDRVIDGASGVTKGELAEYYLQAAPRLLPHLAARPVSLVRGPEGVQGELFFQKHAQTLRVPGLERLDRALDPGHPPLLAVPSLQALMGCVQFNVIEFHTWNATTRAIDAPDRMTFDLDPGEGLAWPSMLEATEVVRLVLEEFKLRSFLKTSGGKGLHVVVPLSPLRGWDEVREIARAIVQHLESLRPDLFVGKSGAHNRVGRIFVDYLRNGRGATTVAAWSARARAGLGVSVPVDWSELQSLASGAHWTVRTAPQRLAEPDPWEGVHKVRQNLRAASKALQAVALEAAS